MAVKAFLSDFDGTIVYKDMLDVLCGIVGKEEESKKLNEEFIADKKNGLVLLAKRINLLKGVSLLDIEYKLKENDYLIEGAEELFNYLHQNGVVTILHSGNILPVLNYYKNKLHIDFVVGIQPRMIGNVVDGISLDDFPSNNFKADGCSAILSQLNIPKDKVIALGDSPSDISVFNISSISIAINPKGDIDSIVDFIIKSNLKEVISILNTLL